MPAKAEKSPRRTKINIFMIAGVLFVIAGIIGLVHPQWQGPQHNMNVDIQGKQVVVNTRRIIDIPPLFCGSIIVMGACLAMLGWIQEAKKRYPR